MLKRNLKMILTVLAIITAVLIYRPTNVYGVASKEMKIYSINVGDGNNGDSTLVESNGEYLLMDIGVEESYENVESFLSNLGVESFSIYFSHFHGDHTGGFSKNENAPLYKLMQKYKINHVYLPDPSLLEYKGKQVEESAEVYYRKTKEFFESSPIQTEDYDDIVTYLKCGSKFTFGSVNVSVIGPVGMDNFTSPLKSGKTEICPANADRELLDDYQNNCSLVSKLVCGNVSFLTAGDLKDEGEKALVKKYKNTDTLKSTIYKMSHHGFYPANTDEFLSYVRPDFTFVSNYSNGGLGSSGKFWAIHTAQMSCNNYGFVYMDAQEKKTLEIDVNNNDISLYRYGESTKLNKEGWTKVVGGDGVNRKYDYYYFGSDGYTKKGVQKIDDKYYYLGTGGYRHYGTGKGSSYNGMKTCTEDGKKRYFAEKDDVMYRGAKTVKDGSSNGMYYFKKDGSLAVSTNGGWQKKKLGDYYYSVYTSGKLSQNVFKEYDGGHCYFGSNGRMLIGWQTINGKRYYLNKENGTRYKGFKRIGKNYYFFSDYGILQTNTKKTIDGVKYEFGSDGKMLNVPRAKKTSISSVSSTTNTITVKWYKKSVDGYKIYASTSKDGTYKKVATIKKGSTKSKTIKSLKSGKRYYIKIRSYNKIGGYYEYSDYSTIKSIKTK